FLIRRLHCSRGRRSAARVGGAPLLAREALRCSRGRRSAAHVGGLRCSRWGGASLLAWEDSAARHRHGPLPAASEQESTGRHPRVASRHEGGVPLLAGGEAPLPAMQAHCSSVTMHGCLLEESSSQPLLA
ncbi:hypothetical protein Dimus_029078, partial [Dionaea muscipula]